MKLRILVAISCAAIFATGCAQDFAPSPFPYIANSKRLSAANVDALRFRVIHNFSPLTPADGYYPISSLIAVNGILYGTTPYGGGSLNGSIGGGTVFSVKPNGKEQLFHTFASLIGGYDPTAALVYVRSSFYGTTSHEGSSSFYGGMAFELNASGNERVLHNFGERAGPNAAFPMSSLLYLHGTLYGTTEYGGTYGAGTVFSVDASGKEHTLHNFGAGLDGKLPLAALIDANGTLYGTTSFGGRQNNGTIFSITTTGKERIVHSFLNGSDGARPAACLLKLGNTLYGTAEYGGAYDGGTVFSFSAGTEKTIHSFGGTDMDGRNPVAGLIQLNGVLYGTTSGGGAYWHASGGAGTVFRTSVNGQEQVLHSFDVGEGMSPVGGVVSMNGTLYGTTEYGGRYDSGTVFALDP